MTLDAEGYPIHNRGVMDGELGLYFLGLPYQHSLVSATIGGVCTDARYIADILYTEPAAGDLSGDRMTAKQEATCPTDLRYLLNLW